MAHTVKENVNPQLLEESKEVLEESPPRPETPSEDEITSQIGPR